MAVRLFPDRKPTNPSPIPSLAAYFALIDCLAQKGAASRPQYRARGPVTLFVQRPTEQGADPGADDEAGGAVAATAMITSVAAAPDPVIPGHHAGLIIGALLGAVPVGRGPWRRIGKGWSRHEQKGGCNCAGYSGDMFHIFLLVSSASFAGLLFRMAISRFTGKST